MVLLAHVLDVSSLRRLPQCGGSGTLLPPPLRIHHHGKCGDHPGKGGEGGGREGRGVRGEEREGREEREGKGGRGEGGSGSSEERSVERRKIKISEFSANLATYLAGEGHPCFGCGKLLQQFHQRLSFFLQSEEMNQTDIHLLMSVLHPKGTITPISAAIM